MKCVEVAGLLAQHCDIRRSGLLQRPRLMQGDGMVEVLLQ
jgi:hypothetical protein